MFSVSIRPFDAHQYRTIKMILLRFSSYDYIVVDSNRFSHDLSVHGV
ncbi:hypothetical protein [Streptococcus parauberis]